MLFNVTKAIYDKKKLTYDDFLKAKKEGKSVAVNGKDNLMSLLVDAVEHAEKNNLKEVDLSGLKVEGSLEGLGKELISSGLHSKLKQLGIKINIQNIDTSKVDNINKIFAVDNYREEDELNDMLAGGVNETIKNWDFSGVDYAEGAFANLTLENVNMDLSHALSVKGAFEQASLKGENNIKINAVNADNIFSRAHIDSLHLDMGSTLLANEAFSYLFGGQKMDIGGLFGSFNHGYAVSYSENVDFDPVYKAGLMLKDKEKVFDLINDYRDQLVKSGTLDPNKTYGMDDKVFLKSDKNAWPSLDLDERSLNVRELAQIGILKRVDGGDRYVVNMDRIENDNGFLAVVGSAVRSIDDLKKFTNFIHLARHGQKAFDDADSKLADMSWYLNSVNGILDTAGYIAQTGDASVLKENICE